MQTFDVYVGIRSEIMAVKPRKPRTFVVMLPNVPRIGEQIVRGEAIYRILDIVHVDGDMLNSPVIFV